MSSMLDLPHPDEPQLLARVPAQPGGLPAQPHLRAVPDLDEPPLDFDDVVRRLTPRLQRYATRRLGDSHEAEELVQEALLRAFDHRADLRTEDDVAAWTTCVTGRLVIDRLRVRGRSTSMAQVPEGTRVGRDTADVVVARDEARLALDALDAMPPRQAAVLWAREVEGLAYDEIGTRFDMTEPAVRSVLMRARKALRKEFATRGGTLPAGGLVALAPWLDGLGWLDRLRRLAGKAAAPAAIGAASLGLIGGTLLPWSSSPGTQVAPDRAVVVAAQDVVQPGAAAFPVSVAPADSAPAAGASRRAPDRAAPEVTTIIEDVGVRDQCHSAAGARAGGMACSPAEDPALMVSVPLPDNPSDIGQVGLESNKVDCSALPQLPFTQCTTPEGEDR